MYNGLLKTEGGKLELHMHSIISMYVSLQRGNLGLHVHSISSKPLWTSHLQDMPFTHVSSGLVSVCKLLTFSMLAGN